jgi:hypothetical protein
MAGWYEAHPVHNTMNNDAMSDGLSRTLNRSTKAVIAVVLLAVVLVAVVPVAFIVALFLMVFGHVVGGLILIGGSVLAATAAVGLAALSGVRLMRHVREMMTGRRPRVLKLNAEDYDRY